MKIGIPKEIKNNENRVGITPAGVKALVKAGHTVMVEKGAGLGSGFADAEFVKAGAKMGTQAQIWANEMVMKVKEPLKSEYKYFRKDLLLFTYLHLAAEKELTEALLKNKVTGVAYETVIGKPGMPRLPLLAPMSEVAGRRSVILAATHLESHNKGLGLLPGGVTGTEKGNFLVIGGGFAGYNAAFTAAGLGANVTILEANPARIKQLKEDKVLNGLSKVFGNKIEVLASNKTNLEKSIKVCDALISTILIPGEKAPKVVTEAQVKMMKKGSVIIDISIDQGGSVATVDRITTHDNPTFVKHGVVHYSVANMPGATPRTSSIALTNATLPYAVKLAKNGTKALLADEGFLEGLNTCAGHCTFEGVAKALKIKYVPAKEALKELGKKPAAKKAVAKKPAKKVAKKK